MTIEQRQTKDGIRYRARVWDNDRGRLVSTSWFAERAEAQKEGRKYEKNLQAGRPARAEDASMSAVWEEYIADFKCSGVSPVTVRNVQNRYRLYIEPTFGDRLVPSITTKDVRLWLLGLEMRELSSRTIEKARGQLSLILDYARTVLHLIDDNVAREINHEKDRKGDVNDRQTWTPEQIGFFLKHPLTEADKCYRLFVVLALTGCRLGEACGLQRQDIDLKTSRIHFQRGISQQGEVTKLKTARSNRRITVPNWLCKDLLDNAGSVWVFQQKSGQPMNPNILKTRFHRLVISINASDYVPKDEMAKINADTWTMDETISRMLKASAVSSYLKAHRLPMIRPYDLRHSVITNLIKSGVSLGVVCDIIGDTLSVVEQYYYHPQQQRKDDTLKQFSDEVFGRTFPFSIPDEEASS